MLLGPLGGEMDQDYERRLLRQINHQNLPAEARLSKVRHTLSTDISDLTPIT